MRVEANRLAVKYQVLSNSTAIACVFKEADDITSQVLEDQGDNA